MAVSRTCCSSRGSFADFFRFFLSVRPRRLALTRSLALGDDGDTGRAERGEFVLFDRSTLDADRVVVVVVVAVVLTWAFVTST
jgi:hypothetical protein